MIIVILLPLKVMITLFLAFGLSFPNALLLKLKHACVLLDGGTQLSTPKKWTVGPKLSGAQFASNVFASGNVFGKAVQVLGNMFVCCLN